MANLYMPSHETFEKMKSLLQGFLLELDVNGNPVLLLKLEASLSNSVINGCAIEIALRNLNIERRSCTLYIYDILNNPFYVTGKNFGNEDKIIQGFDEVAIKLASSKKVTMVLFNEFTHPFFTTELEIQSDTHCLDKWLFNVYNSDVYKYITKTEIEGHYFPENEIKSFKVKIFNKDNSKTEKLIILAPEYNEKWRENLNLNNESFNHDDYNSDGKHGYYQELSIVNGLSRHLRPEIDFFISPKYQNGNEFIDFVILSGKNVILIESKYVLSEKQTKKHAAIVKAINQLNKVEELILSKNIDLTNEKLTKLLISTEHVSKICLINNKLILSNENTKSITDKFFKEELPIFISVTTLFQLLGSLELKNKNFVVENLCLNFQYFYSGYLNSEMKILCIREFSMEGLTIDELNRLGEESFKKDSK